MNIIIDKFETLQYYKKQISENNEVYDVIQRKDNKLYLLDTKVSTDNLLSLNFKKEFSTTINNLHIKNYEKNTYILNENVCKKTNSSVLPSIEHLIYRINLITKKINMTTGKKYKIRLRTLRKVFMKSILPFISNAKYFIMPYVLPYLYISKNFAIVGNSRRILEKETGKEIDSHSNVMRFNYAVIDNDTKYCGGKSDIRVSIRKCITGDRYKAHPEGLINNYNLYRTLRDKHYIVFTKEKSLKASDLIQDCKNNKINTKSKTYHCAYWTLERHREILLSLNIKTNFEKFLQCGFGFLLYIIDLGIVPDVYGFDLKLCSNNYGYYWNKKVVHKKLSKFHDINIEHIMLKQLIKNNKIIYH